MNACKLQPQYQLLENGLKCRCSPALIRSSNSIQQTGSVVLIEISIYLIFRFTDQPQAVAQQVLQTGGYGIVTIGYGTGVTDLVSLQV